MSCALKTKQPYVTGLCVPHCSLNHLVALQRQNTISTASLKTTLIQWHFLLTLQNMCVACVNILLCLMMKMKLTVNKLLYTLSAMHRSLMMNTITL